MRRDWLLVGSDIRLRAGVLSHWLRGRHPTMTAEVFQSRWCHEEVASGGDRAATHALHSRVSRFHALHSRFHKLARLPGC